jgi:hypothetical protein
VLFLCGAVFAIVGSVLVTLSEGAGDIGEAIITSGGSSARMTRVEDATPRHLVGYLDGGGQVRFASAWELALGAEEYIVLVGPVEGGQLISCVLLAIPRSDTLTLQVRRLDEDEPLWRALRSAAGIPPIRHVCEVGPRP